jgi:DNA-binding LacI/PurR family transcriptional regulator
MWFWWESCHMILCLGHKRLFLCRSNGYIARNKNIKGIMSKRPVTIKDIARQLNISVATVSRALRNSEEIKKETKLAVLQMAKEMDYHPNLLASSLSSKKSKILGVVVPTINRQFWSNAISGIEHVAYQAGYKVMIFQSSESYHKEVEIVEILANSRVDGILMAFSKETEDFRHIHQVMARGIPVLLFERVCEELQSSKIVTDNYEGARQVVQHLVDRGKTRIAYLSGHLSLKVCRERYEGYKDTLPKNGLAIKPELIIEIPEFSYEGAAKAFQALWEKNIDIDAVFCFADILAIGVLHAARQLRIDVPGQLAVAGFGNDDTSKFVSPAITTMAQPSFEMGETSANMILEQILTEDIFAPITKVIKTKLVVRESS